MKKVIPVFVEAKIESLSHEGRGITRVNGKTVFVEGALPGEKVKFKYLSRKSKFDEAIITEIISPSEQRTVPECKYFMNCGGCSLQHMHPQFQMHHKQDVLLEQLNYIGKVSPLEVLPSLSGDVWSYRHKARFGVRYDINKEKVLVGFREKNKQTIADIEECKVLHSSIGNFIFALKILIERLTVKSQIPQIEVAIGDVNRVIVIRHLIDLSREDVVLLETFSDDYRMNIYLQNNAKSTIQALSEKHNQPLSYYLEEFGIKITFSPLDFIQVNLNMNRKMISSVISLLMPQKTESILDLFCGLGNFTLPIALLSNCVTGVEGSSSLVQRGKENADFNKISNAEFYCENLYSKNINFHFNDKKYDKILLDPPRSGAREVIEKINFKETSRVVYVSCNPATLARDAGILVHKKGYSLSKVGIIDMFPHTTHVESLAVFERT